MANSDSSAPNPERGWLEGEKPQVYIPGAASAGMFVLLVSLTMLFLASIAAFLIIRYQFMHRTTGGETPAWPPAGLPHIPQSLWISTLVILISSFTIQKALNAIRHDDERRMQKLLKITFGLGLLFLLCQMANWIEFFMAIPKGTGFSGDYLTGFYILTGLHAAHVLGGLIPLALVIMKSKRGMYSRNFHPGVRYSAVYWHFLDVIWILLFIVIMF